MPLIKKILTASRKPALTVFIAIFAVSGVAFAQSAFTQPASAPPGGNVSAPVNVGTVFQQKLGQFWAKSMGTDDGYCIGDSCITEWPTNPIANCQMCVSIVPDTGSDNSKARQCGTGAASQVLCSPVDQWTTPYRDDTDDRKGGCQMQWKLDCTAPYGDSPAPAPGTYTGDGNDEVVGGGGGGGDETLQMNAY